MSCVVCVVCVVCDRYAIQNFLEVDPHLGTREDLIELVKLAHSMGMYVLLDVIFNHTGDNFFYKHEGKMVSTMPYRDHHKHPFGAWKDEHGKRTRLPPTLARTAFNVVIASG